MLITPLISSGLGQAVTCDDGCAPIRTWTCYITGDYDDDDDDERESLCAKQENAILENVH